MRHAVATLLGTVQRTIRAHALITPGTRVLVAVSGGGDSTGLLLALTTLQRKLGVTLLAAHVNHRLRGGDADLDEAAAAASAAALGVPFVRAELPAGLRRGGNLEARARRMRYAALAALAAEHGCAAVATGHTLDDQAETVLMRLIRGSGGRGLAAIRPRRGDGVVRPLLDCRRAAVAAAVAAAGLAWREDGSNRDRRFLRTHVRERVLPLLAELNPAVARACANLAAGAAAERAIVGAWAQRRLARAGAADRLAIEDLRRLAAGPRRVLVRAWLLAAGIPAGRLAARHVEAVLGLAEAERGGTETHLALGWRARRERGTLCVERRARAAPRRPAPSCPAPL